MLKFNTFRAKRYLKTRFVEGDYLLASEASDLELEVMDLFRQAIKSSIGDVAVEDAWKVERLSDTELLIKPGEAWIDGLPVFLRSTKDQLVGITGAAITPGILPAGVTLTDDASGNGKILTLTPSTTPTELYRMTVTVQEELITDVEDPFIKNANLTETTAQKIRLNFKVNLVKDSAQDLSPVPYTDETAVDPNLSNKLVITPAAGLNGEQIGSVIDVTGSANIDGRDIEITVINESSPNNAFPIGSTEQKAFTNGRLIDSEGTEYHINLIKQGNNVNEIVLRIDKEPNQPNPSLINGQAYTLVKRDVFVTDDVSGAPLGKMYWDFAKLDWNTTNGIVHDSAITDLRTTVKESSVFQDKVTDKLDLFLAAGGDLSWSDANSLLTWSNDLKLISPYGPVQTIAAAPASSVSAIALATSDTTQTNTMSSVNDFIGQTFLVTPNDWDLDNVVMRIEKVQNPTGNLVVEIYTDNSTTPDTLVATSNPVDITSLSGFGNVDDVTFTFPTQPTLSSGNVYWAVLRTDSLTLVNGSNYPRLWSGAGLYGAGILFTSSNQIAGPWVSTGRDISGFQVNLIGGGQPLVDGGSLIYEMDLTSGGAIGRGTLAVNSTSSGTSISLTGSPDLSTVRIGNTVVDDNGTVGTITDIDDVNDTLTVDTSMTFTASGTIYLDSYAAQTAPKDVENFVLAVRDGSKVYVGINDLELESGETNQLGDGISAQNLTYIGATGESDSDPNYSSVGVISQGDDLTTAIGKLDASLTTTKVGRVTIGPSGSGADYETDGTDDNLTFDAAVADAKLATGGIVQVLTGVYNFSGDHNFANGLQYRGTNGVEINLPSSASLGTGANFADLQYLRFDPTDTATFSNNFTLLKEIDFFTAGANTVIFNGAVITEADQVSFQTVEFNSGTCQVVNSIIVVDAAIKTDTRIANTGVTRALMYSAGLLRFTNGTIGDLRLEDTINDQVLISNSVIDAFSRASTEESTNTIITGCTSTSGTPPSWITGNFTGNIPRNMDNNVDRLFGQKNAFFRSDDPVTWTGTELQFTSDIILETITDDGVAQTYTVLAADSPLTPGDGEYLYLNVDRTTASATVSFIVDASAPAEDIAYTEMIPFATRRDIGGAGYLHLPLHKQVLSPGQTVRLGASGEGGSEGSGIGPAPGYQWLEFDSMEELPSSSDTKVDSTNTNATHSVGDKLYQLSCDKSLTCTTTGTDYVLSGAPGFTVAVGDIIYDSAQGEFRKIAALDGGTSQTDGTLDAAFTSDLSAAAVLVSQAVWTKDLVNLGDATEKTRARDFFSGDIQQILIDYQDSLASGDAVADFVDEARLVVSASNEGLVADTGLPASDTFSGVFTRPQAPNTILDYPLGTNTNQERLHLVFFCNPANASVTTTANLIRYEANFYVDDSELNSGVLEDAICFSDNSSTPISCTVATPASETEVTLDWAYVPNVRAGQPSGNLDVYVDGKRISRFVSASETPATDLYYTEEADTNGVYNKVKFNSDLSANSFEIVILKRFGVFDVSDENASKIATLFEAIVGSAEQVTAGIATHSSIQAAHDSFSGPGEIKLLIGTFTENVTWSNDSLKLEGKGKGSILDGTIDVSGEGNVIRDIKFNNNVTLSGDKNRVEGWIAAAATDSDTGTDNLWSYIED